MQRKRARRAYRHGKFAVATAAFRDMERIHPYAYRPERYSDTFLATDVEVRGTSAFPRQVFALWTGSNPMSENRSRNLEAIKESIGLPLELVTPATLHRWLVPGHPLHPAYEQLSLIHRSDYLRGYLMHHHGGAYVDIKLPLASWEPAWRQMADDPAAWVTSYRADHADWIGKLPGRLGRDLLVRYRLMFGKGGFMMRSYTPITASWVEQMHRVLDSRLDALSEHPGGVFGDAGGYPLGWTDLLGRILDPLTLKYADHVRFDERLLLDFHDYR
ncbi:hypothetical protein [Nocardioides sp.]|uniref:hypothetical protein n=1 Tax=Nocardioides sp. TaxID=35761 RepID=UPI002625108E|nr:hypothetical protein [Nocardioides sp.]